MPPRDHSAADLTNLAKGVLHGLEKLADPLHDASKVKPSIDRRHRRWRGILCSLFLAAIPTSLQAGYQYGSGFFVHPDGYVLTNEHVTSDSKEIVVVTSTGIKLPAVVVKKDAYKDLALLKVEIDGAPALPLGSSTAVQILEPVVAIGFPYADRVGFELSAYDGKINAIRTSGPIPLLQMDANVNSGSSGGPVLNENGQVVGVTMAKIDKVRALLEDGDIPERMNFAIPIDEAKGVLSPAFPLGYQMAEKVDASKPAEIFERAKASVALVVARTKDVSIEKALPVPKPPPQESSAALDFISAFVASGNTGSRSDFGAFFTDRVDYMDSGGVTRDFIVKDHRQYQVKWPRRSYRLSSAPQVFKAEGKDFSVAIYTVSFSVENASRRISGEAKYTLGMTDESSPLIFDLKEEITSRKVVKK